MTNTVVQTTNSRDSHEYPAFLAAMQTHAASILEKMSDDLTFNLFTVERTKSVFELFLNALPSDNQHYNCNACHRFFTKYGSLVIIDNDGYLHSPFWDEAVVPDFFKPAVKAVKDYISTKRLANRVFFSDEEVWGYESTNGWSHIHYQPSAKMLGWTYSLAASQGSAKVTESVKTVRTALLEYPTNVIEQAVTLLMTDKLPMSEKFIEPAMWFQNLSLMWNSKTISKPCKENLLLKAVAMAPNGYVHTRSSVVGSLLGWLKDGDSFQSILGKFTAMVDPMKYKRAQVAPSAGNVAAAEKLIAELGVGESLKRRWATVDEVEYFWKPKPVEVKETPTGLFGHLQTKDSTPQVKSLAIPSETITWSKFLSKVLPTVSNMQFFVPGSRTGYFGLTTAEVADAPPIIKWDRIECRNPVSFYHYQHGARSKDFNLEPLAYVDVLGLSYLPHQWNGGVNSHPHMGNGMLIVLKGCHDLGDPSLALFPDTLIGALHPIRSTIEAYSNAGKLMNRAVNNAGGIGIHEGASLNFRLRVIINGQSFDYTIDRWD